MKVTKRDGTKENYSIQTVKRAIREAFKSSKQKYSKDIINEITSTIDPYDGIPVEDIQDQIETSLYSHNYPMVAKEFILYRNKKRQIRDWVKNKEEFIEKYKRSTNTANSTVDDNSNVASKNIGVLNAEIHKGDNINVSRGMVTHKLKELFPEFNAKQYVKDLKSHIIYKHDESSFSGAIAPYCCSITMYPFLNYGLENIGGLSAHPQNLDSFCGMFINLIFATSAQFAGACLYKDQKLKIKEYDNIFNISAKNLINKFNLNNKFQNFQGTWEYCNIEDKNYFINEDNKFVKINKVYRRKYNDLIYKIKTKDNHIAYVSKDHIFKVLYCNRILEVKAKDLHLYDTVFMNKDNSYMIDYEHHDFKEGFIKGALCGDGCITNYGEIRLSVNYNQKYIIDIFNEYLNELYNIRLESCTDGKGCYDFRKYSTSKYKEICENIKGTNCYDKHLDDIENKSLNYLIGFLDGLSITDGSYQSNGRGISLSLTNELLIKNVDDILNILEIKHNKYTSYQDKRKNKHIVYRIYMPQSIIPYLKHTLIKKLNNKVQQFKKPLYDYAYSPSAFTKQTNYKRMLWSCSNQNIKYNTDVIIDIETFVNDDEYVYEIETSTHWYNCGGFITHNCATSEFLLYFDYFAKKEYGEDYYKHADEFFKIGPKLRELLNKTHYWCSDINELREHDFGSDELNKIRDELVYDSTRELSKDELNKYEDELAKRDRNDLLQFTNPIKIGDGTRTIGSCIQQYFQQVV